MSEIAEWVQENREAFDSIADRSGLPEELIHVAAVLVQAGLSDAQIIGECEAFRFRLGTSEGFEEKLAGALALLHALIDAGTADSRIHG